MSKVRVYEVARELGVENRELIQRMSTMGIQVRNHMSVIEAAEAERVKRAMKQGSNVNFVEERIRPTVVRRKRKKADVVEADAGAEAVEAAAPASASVLPASDVPSAAPHPVSETPSASESVSATPVEAAASEPLEQEASAPPSAPPVVEEAVSFAPPVQTVDKPTSPPSEGDKFGHAPLPPGVMRRGNAVASGAVPLSDVARRRIVAEHAATREAPRRREIRGRSSIGPTGRPQGRPGKKTSPAGQKA